MDAIVVRRGLKPAYYFFTEITAKSNAMGFIVDRRLHERRNGLQPADIDARVGSRRAAPPHSWTRDGFMVTPAAV